MLNYYNTVKKFFNNTYRDLFFFTVELDKTNYRDK